MRTKHSLRGERPPRLASQLRAWDIAADETPDAEGALQALTAAAEFRPYDIALLDIAMPGMDGLALAATITSDPRLASLRVLPMSSDAEEAAAAAAAGLGATLTKPIRLSSLYDALVRVVSPSPVVPANPVAAKLTVPASSRGTLLIVEDHAINQEVARGMAAKLGYGSDIASDGLEALEALERRPYDAVLMDCHMPQMDGFQATAKIRRREAGRRHVPIIAMTAGALVQDREKCMAGRHGRLPDETGRRPRPGCGARPLGRARRASARSGAAPSQPGRRRCRLGCRPIRPPTRGGGGQRRSLLPP
ncbi:MAG: response regulator [Acidimicrobiales bacterium]